MFLQLQINFPRKSLVLSKQLCPTAFILQRINICSRVKWVHYTVHTTHSSLKWILNCIDKGLKNKIRLSLNKQDWQGSKLFTSFNNNLRLSTTINSSKHLSIMTSLGLLRSVVNTCDLFIEARPSVSIFLSSFNWFRKVHYDIH